MRRAILMLAALALLLAAGNVRAGMVGMFTLKVHEEGGPADVTLPIPNGPQVEIPLPAAFTDYAGSTITLFSSFPGTAGKGLISMTPDLVSNVTAAPHGSLTLTLLQTGFSTPGGSNSTLYDVESDFTLEHVVIESVVGPLSASPLVSVTSTINTTSLPTQDRVSPGTNKESTLVTVPDGSFLLTFTLQFSPPPSSAVTTTSSVTLTATPAVPEPASITLLGIGSISLLGYCWRRRKQVVA
jgi:hypothetical protein